MGKSVRADDPLAHAATSAIQTGDLTALERLLDNNPDLATFQIEGHAGGYRSLLHVVADWPGYFPNGPAVVRLLLARVANPSGGADGYGRQETPLHWAASSDDVDVSQALIVKCREESPICDVKIPIQRHVGEAAAVVVILLGRGRGGTPFSVDKWTGRARRGYGRAP